MLTMEEIFRNAIIRVAEVLDMGEPEVSPSFWTAAEDRIDYTAEIEWKGRSMVDLELLGEIKPDESVVNLKYSIEYVSSYGITQFFRQAEYSDNEDALSFEEWIEPHLHEIVRLREVNDLDFLFGDCPINVHGTRGVTNKSLLWLRIILLGYENLNPGRILVYKMQHVGESGSVSYSYAILVMYRQEMRDYSSWSLFPDFVGSEGGTGRQGYRSVEETIQEVCGRTKVDLVEFQVPIQSLEEKLGQWLLGRLASFFSAQSVKDLDPLENPLIEECLNQELAKGVKSPKLWKLYGRELVELNDHLTRKEYKAAIRGLLALVEDAGRELCKLKGIQLPSRATISKIVDKLIKGNVLDERLRPWFAAYSSYSTKSKHRVYPTKTSLRTFKERMTIRITVILGKFLLSQIFLAFRESQ